MILARLPLPLYITTNYDTAMFDGARRGRGRTRSATLPVEPEPDAEGEPSPSPTPLRADSRPTRSSTTCTAAWAFHESMVLTEDDYLDFLVSITREPDLLPHLVQRALAGTSLVFLGYRLADWDFRVIHRGLVAALEASLRRLSVTVQLDRRRRCRARLSRPVLLGAEAPRLLGHRAGVRRRAAGPLDGAAMTDEPRIARRTSARARSRRRTARCSSGATPRSPSSSRSSSRTATCCCTRSPVRARPRCFGPG